MSGASDCGGDSMMQSRAAWRSVSGCPVTGSLVLRGSIGPLVTLCAAHKQQAPTLVPVYKHIIISLPPPRSRCSPACFVMIQVPSDLLSHLVIVY